MKFTIFTNTVFNISDPISLIESYCFQSDFYPNYDRLIKREMRDANKIGARIKNTALEECIPIIENSGLPIFKHNLDSFLRLTEKTRTDYIKGMSSEVVQRLLGIKGIGFAKVTKILHTGYPKIIPMIDNPLQKFYSDQTKDKWTDQHSDEIFTAFYDNLLIKETRKNINRLYETLKKNGVTGLTKIRIFDILWWSYLKSNSLKEKYNIRWSSIF
jgi:hypothetical protein